MKRRIFIQKIDVNPEGAKAMDWNDYKPGTGNNIKEGLSLPVNYSIEGYLLSDIFLGEPVVVDRYKRNDILAPGIFTSSPVVTITPTYFTTKNSVYHYKFLD